MTGYRVQSTDDRVQMIVLKWIQIRDAARCVPYLYLFFMCEHIIMRSTLLFAFAHQAKAFRLFMYIFYLAQQVAGKDE